MTTNLRINNSLRVIIHKFLVLCMILAVMPASSVWASDSIERVEPPFWWTGFKNTSVQLMVHGNGISEFDVQLSYPDVSITDVTQTKNPNYMFITLDIAASAKAGQVMLSFSGAAGRGDFTYAYDLRAREPQSAERKGFNGSDAIYLITPDRFANGVKGNDSIAGLSDTVNRDDKDGRHGGDIQGIIDHLDYIDGMGFTALWSTPLLENAQPRTSYHGYAITDLYKVDPRFGSNEDYIELSQKMRARGMGLINDMVANHIGSGHWWMKDLPAEDWLNFPDDYVQSNHERTLNHDPYGSSRDRDVFSDGWFDRAMPDLNQRNPLLATYLIQNSIWWVEYADLAGIRMDTYSYPDKDFMANWSKEIMDEYPNFNIVGEEYAIDPTLVSYWQRGKVNADGYVSHLPSVMDIPLQDAMAVGLAEEEAWGHGLIKMYRGLSNDWLYADPQNLMILPDNHDMPRIFSQINEDFDLYKMAIAYTLTMRGIPQIYYGTEILKTSPKVRDDGLVRSDFPGGWAGDTVNAFVGTGLSQDQKSAQTYMRKLLNWRKEKTVVHSGKLMHFVPEKGTYVYFRYNDNDKIMVILNKNHETTSLSLVRFSEMLDEKNAWSDVITGETVTLEGTLTLEGRSVTILEINNDNG